MMAMVSVSPTQVDVRCGYFDGRPRAIVLAEEELPVLAIEHVRLEAAAYPALRGPRTIFEVRTAQARLRLVFEHRRRRWLLDALDTARARPGAASDTDASGPPEAPRADDHAPAAIASDLELPRAA